MTERYESRASTHADDCWSWGPGHYECAVRKIGRLRAENERLHEQLRLATVDQAIAEAEANDAHAENKRLAETLEELITWTPSADTYRRFGFDPEAPMRAWDQARGKAGGEVEGG